MSPATPLASCWSGVNRWCFESVELFEDVGVNIFQQSQPAMIADIGTAQDQPLLDRRRHRQEIAVQLFRQFFLEDTADDQRRPEIVVISDVVVDFKPVNGEHHLGFDAVLILAVGFPDHLLQVVGGPEDDVGVIHIRADIRGVRVVETERVGQLVLGVTDLHRGHGAAGRRMVHDGRIGNEAELAQRTGRITETGLAEAAPLVPQAAAADLGMQIFEGAVIAGDGAETGLPDSAFRVFGDRHGLCHLAS